MFGKRKTDHSQSSNPEKRLVGEPLRCSFCNKVENDVRKLIAGPSVFICDECVELCVEIIANDPRLQALSQDSTESQRRHATTATLPQNSAACCLCGKSASLTEMLPVENRGLLCGECADVIEDAIAEGKPVS